MNATTAFVNDAEVVLGQVIAQKTLGQSLNESSGFAQDFSIREFLAKPIIVTRGVLSASDTFTTFAPFTLPAAGIPALVGDKLKGYYGFTATSVITLQINGNPFQSGRYMLYYIPIGGVRDSDPATTTFCTMHENTLRARTQLPRIELDVNCDTQGQLRIPFVSSRSFFELVSASSGVSVGSVARVRLAPYESVYSPAGSNTVPFTIWHHFEDVHLVGAAIPQMGSLSEQEGKKAGIGPLQSSAITVSKTMSMLNSVPLLSAYSRPLGWVADMVAGVASSYGWSKPLDQAPIMRSLRTALPYMANVNAPDSGYNLGAFTNNEISVLPGFAGTDLDEMSLASVATRPAFIQSFSWAASGSSGDVLATFRCCPQPVTKIRTYLPYFIEDHTPASFTATLFSYWRGSVVFDFKLVKTKFHSGRLLVTFSPSVWSIGSTTSDVNSSSYEWRTIIDVREQSTFRVQIPYLSAEQYLPTSQNSTTVLPHFGTIQVIILDPLVAPATVGNSIRCLVEHSMGPDCEFAVPAPCNMMPVVDATPEMNMSSDPCEVYSGVIGNAQVTDDKGFNAAACMGERVSSFRQLLKSVNLLQDFLPQNGPTISVVPFAIQTMSVASLPALPVHTGDLYGMLASCFNLVRGSVRFKAAIPYNTTVWQEIAYLTQTSNNGLNVPVAAEHSVVTKQILNFMGTGVAGNMGSLNQTGYSLQNLQANGGLEVTVPNYSQYHSRASAAHMLGSTNTYPNDNWTVANRTRLTITCPQGNTEASMVFRGAGDDINMSGFISIPPLFRGVGVGYHP